MDMCKLTEIARRLAPDDCTVYAVKVEQNRFHDDEVEVQVSLEADDTRMKLGYAECIDESICIQYAVKEATKRAAERIKEARSDRDVLADALREHSAEAIIEAARRGGLDGNA